MPKRDLDPNALGHDEDWEGNNIAFRCPPCGKVYIVNSTLMHRGYRKCPECGRSAGRVSTGGRKSGGTARIEWED